MSPLGQQAAEERDERLRKEKLERDAIPTVVASVADTQQAIDEYRVKLNQQKGTRMYTPTENIDDIFRVKITEDHLNRSLVLLQSLKHDQEVYDNEIGRFMYESLKTIAQDRFEGDYQAFAAQALRIVDIAEGE